MKLLLETVTYITIKERVTSENTTCIIATETPICIITLRIVIHIFAAETATCIYAADTSNCIIATETVTCIVVTERSTNIPVTESITSKPAKCNRRHLHNCHRMCQLHIFNRNCHLQNWQQKLSLAETVSIWYSFSYNKEIKQKSKHLVLVLLVYLNGETRQCIVSMNFAIY